MTFDEIQNQRRKDETGQVGASDSAWSRCRVAAGRPSIAVKWEGLDRCIAADIGRLERQNLQGRRIGQWRNRLLGCSRVSVVQRARRMACRQPGQSGGVWLTRSGLGELGNGVERYQRVAQFGSMHPSAFCVVGRRLLGGKMEPRLADQWRREGDD